MSEFADLEVEIQRISNSQTLNEIVDGLRDYELPPDIVPLSKNRHPFRELSDRAICVAVYQTIQYPEKIGRLSASIRHYLNLPYKKPKDYILKETHIDVTNLDDGLLDELVILGFEQDHFVKIHPPEYTCCLTMEFAINRYDRDRLKAIHKFLVVNSRRAMDIIQRHPTSYGYIEVESYSSTNVTSYPFTPVTTQGLNHFPFKNKDFSVFHLPSTPEESEQTEIPLSWSKRVDIHVKMPSASRGKEFIAADTPEMKQLRKLITEMGFYEIISDGGNYIYTGQFLDVPQAKFVFSQLDAFGSTWGGITGIKFEICSDFWRKDVSDHAEEIKLANIPFLVELDYRKFKSPFGD